jgi:hypothetical protein
MTTEDQRLQELTAREKALIIRSKARKRQNIDLPLDLYEALIDQSEAWDTPVPDVMRACLKRGLEYIKQFGSSTQNPYATGALSAPLQSEIDPTGTAWPPTNPLKQFAQSIPWPDAPLPYINPTEQATPVRFTGPPRDLAGLLPSGATISTGSGTRTPSKPPIISLDADDDAEDSDQMGFDG